MNILLTEDSLKFLMDNVINEAVGVPDNIYETAAFIYDNIKGQLKNLKTTSFTEKTSDSGQSFYETSFEINKRLTIGNQNFFKIELSLNLYPSDGHYEVDMFNASFLSNASYDDEKRKIFTKKDGTIMLSIDLVTPRNQRLGDVIWYFDKNKTNMISVLTHELKHAYDIRMNNIEDPRNRANYKTYDEVNFEVNPMNEFIHYLYYVTNTESLVRSSEVYAQTKELNITQKQFKTFLSINKTFLTLNKIKNWSYSNMKKELLRYMGQIDNILERIDASPEILNGTPEQRVNEYCRICYVTLVYEKATNLVDTVSRNPFERIFGLPIDKKKMVNDFYRQVSRFKDNFDGFYEYEEKNFKFVADKMMKKISKLYSLLDDENMKNEQKSIVNWELNHKLGLTKKVNYQTEIKSPVNNQKNKGQK